MKNRWGAAACISYIIRHSPRCNAWSEVRKFRVKLSNCVSSNTTLSHTLKHIFSMMNVVWQIGISY